MPAINPDILQIWRNQLKRGDTQTLAKLYLKRYPDSKITRDTFSRALRIGRASDSVTEIMLNFFYKKSLNKC